MKFVVKINLVAAFALCFLLFVVIKASPFPGGGNEDAGSPSHVFLSSHASTSPTHSQSNHPSAHSSPKAKKTSPEQLPNVDSPKQYTSRTAGYYLANAGHNLAMAGTTLIGNAAAGGFGAAYRATKAGLVKSHVIGHSLTPEQRSNMVKKELHQAKEVGKSGLRTSGMHTLGFVCGAGCNLISSGAQVGKTFSRHGAAEEAYPNHNDHDSFKAMAHHKKVELSGERKETRSQTFHGMLDMARGKQPVYESRRHA